MTHDPEPRLTPFDALVIVRLLVGPAKGDPLPKLTKDLAPIVPGSGSPQAVGERIEQTIERWLAGGLIERVGGKTKKAVPKILLTTEGRRAGLTFLGLEELPPKTTWAAIKKSYLPARVLGLGMASPAARKAVASDATFKAALFKKTFDLPIAALPKPAEALDALTWKLMGFEDKGEKLTLKAIKTAIFNRALGDGRTTDFARAAGQLLARRIGAMRDDPREFRDATLRHWLEPTEPLSPSPPPELDPVEFASRVKAAAAACRTGRQGANKVFIAHVWRSLEHEPAFAAMGLDRFKERLAQANHQRLLDLGPADLVHAMNPDDLRLSAVRYLDTTFHFVRI